MPTIDVKDAANATVALEKPNANGQGTMATSRPVVIASDQSAIPISSSLLTLIEGKTPALGQATAPGCTPVVVAADQAAIPVVSQAVSGNIIGADLPSWTVGADCALSAISGAPALTGVQARTLTFNTAAGIGLYTATPIAGRTDGCGMIFSIYARNTNPGAQGARSLLLQIRCDAADGTQTFQFPVAVTIPADSAWYRVSFPFQIDLGLCTSVLLRIYGTPGTSYALDLSGVMLEQSDALSLTSSYTARAPGSGTFLVWPTNRTSICAIGDSLVGGAGGFEFRTDLSRMLNGSIVTNDGVGAEISTMIRERFVHVAWVISTAYTVGQYRSNGGNLYRCTTAGTSAGSGGPTGTGIGIADGTAVWSYYNTTSAQLAKLRNGIVVLEMGRNNVASVTTVVDDIGAVVAIIPHGRYVVMEVWNNTSEPNGSATYQAVENVNDRLASIYGQRFCRWRDQLNAGQNTDIPNVNLMIDATHPNRAGHGAVARSLYESFRDNGYLRDVAVARRTQMLDYAPAVRGSITSATSEVQVPLGDGYNGAVFALQGTYAGVSVVGEAQYGDAWIPALAWNMTTTQTRQTAAQAPGTNASVAYWVDAPGANRVRLRATAWTSGTSNVVGVARTVPPFGMPIGTLGSTTLAALPTGGNTIGNVIPIPSTAQGHSTQHRQALIANITTGAPTSVKTSATATGSLCVANNSGTGVWFHVYNKASAPTMGTDTPAASFWCPTGSNTDIQIAALSSRLTTGFAYAICDNCAAAPTAGATITIAGTATAICVSATYT